MSVVTTRGATASPEEQSAINDDFISKVKHSVIFDSNWNATYNHIPTSMSLIAKCNVYAAMPSTSSIDFSQLSKFDLFKSTSLAACLDEVVNATQLAFNTAETKFGGINERANSVFDVLSEKLFPGLGDLELNPSQIALKSVKQAVDTLQTDANSAKSAVTEISQRFESVLALAMELHRASVEYANMAAKNAKSAQLLAYTKSVELVQVNAAVNTDLESVKNCKGVLTDTQAAYDKASKDMPTVGQAVGYGIAMAFTDVATSAVTQFIQQFVAEKNNSSKSQQGIDAGNQGSSLNPSGQGMPNGQPGSGYVDIDPSKTISNQGDPAYALAQKDSAFIMTLSSLVLSGPNNGIDWSSVGTTLSGLIQQLEFSRDQGSLTNAGPSVELKAILNDGISMATQIQSASSADPPAAASETVQGWQTTMKDVSRRISALCAQSNAAPGSGGAVGATRPAAAPISAAATGTGAAASASSLMAIAQQNLSTAQAGLSVALDNYTSSSKKLGDDQIALGKARAEMLTAQSQEKTLEEIVALLTLITAVMIDFNTQINYLVLHFDALVEMVSSIMDNSFNPFLNDLQSQVDESQKDISHGGLGGIHPSAIARHTIYVSGCTTAAYFDLFGDVASTWIDMSKKFINAQIDTDGAIHVINTAGAPWPAFKAVKDNTTPAPPPPNANPTELPPPDSRAGVKAVEWDPEVKRELDQRLSAIDTWAQKATTGIQGFIDNNNTAAMKRIQAHLTAITSTLTELPEPPPAHVQTGAIEGKTIASSEVKGAIDQSTNLAAVPDMAYGNSTYSGKAHRGG